MAKFANKFHIRYCQSSMALRRYFTFWFNLYNLDTMEKRIGLKEFSEIEQDVKNTLMDNPSRLKFEQLLFTTACEHYEWIVQLMHTDKDCFDNPDNIHRFVKAILTDAAYMNISPVYKRKPL